MPPTDATALTWQRVSPIAMVYFALKTLRALVHLWPTLIPLVAGGESVRQWFFTWGIPAVIFLVLLGVVLHWWFFSFAIEEKRLTLRSGVFNRTRLSLDFERVQQADIAHPFYFRPFNLATLGLESAGSSQQEVDVPGIPIAMAESLRKNILEQQLQAGTGEQTLNSDTGTPHKTAPDYQLNLNAAEIVRYGLMHNSLLYLAPLAAPFGQYLGPVFEQSLMQLEASQWYSLFNWLSTNLAISIGVVLAVFAVLVGTTFLFGLSVILALFRFWNFELTRVGERYQSRAGLTTIRTRGFKTHKLQKVTLTQGLIAKCLKRYTVHISKAGGGVAVQTPQSQDKHFLVPVVDWLNWLLLRDELNMPAARWRRVHSFSWRFPFVVYSALICTLSAAFAIAFGPWALLGLLLLPLAFFINRRLWRQKGYFYNGEWLAWRKGFIGFSEQWLPVGKLQKIEVCETPLKRWVGLCDLQVLGADGKVSLVCLPKAEAHRLRDGLLTGVVMYKKPWF